MDAILAAVSTKARPRRCRPLRIEYAAELDETVMDHSGSATTLQSIR